MGHFNKFLERLHILESETRRLGHELSEISQKLIELFNQFSQMFKKMHDERNLTESVISSFQFNNSVNIELIREELKATDNDLELVAKKVNDLEQMDLDSKLEEQNRRIIRTEDTVQNITKTADLMNENVAANISIMKDKFHIVDIKVSELERANFGERIDVERRRVNEISEKVANLSTYEADIANLKGKSSDMATDIETLENELNIVRSRINQAEDEISDLKDSDFGGQILRQSEKISALERNFNGKFSSIDSSIVSVRSSVTTISTQISDLSSDIANAERRIETVEIKITELENANFGSQIDALNSRLHEYTGCCRTTQSPTPTPSPTTTRGPCSVFEPDENGNWC